MSICDGSASSGWGMLPAKQSVRDNPLQTVWRVGWMPVTMSMSLASIGIFVKEDGTKYDSLALLELLSCCISALENPFRLINMCEIINMHEGSN